ncbi:capsid protein [Picobirnavirus Equ2]|nr:capsid protein [Picobirnavirus Equ2]
MSKQINKSTRSNKGKGRQPRKGNPRSEVSSVDKRNTGDTYNAMEHSDNDVTWYAHNPQMLKDAATVSYNAAVGSKLPWDYYNSRINVDNIESFPGIAVMANVLVPGKTLSGESALNVAADNVYSFVRYMNSGSTNYDAPDLMLYILALDQLYAMWNAFARGYKIATTFSQTNRYLSRGLLESLGFDADDVLRHLADYRLMLNAAAAEISAFCCPANMSVFTRHSWMSSNIYKDADTDKAQLYAFKTWAFGKYDETGDVHGGSIKYVNVCGYNAAPLTVDKMREHLNDFLVPLLRSEDMGIMSGDILKAYGQANLHKLNPISEADYIEPVYNPEVLMQIENLRMFAPASEAEFSANWNITQDVDNGKLVWNPKSTYVNSKLDLPVIINMHSNNPTPEETMVASRLITMCEYTDEDTKVEISVCGTEVVTNMRVYRFGTISGKWQLRYFDVHTAEVITEGTTLTNALVEFRKFGFLEQFDWHPIVYLLERTVGTGGHLILQGIFCDLNTYSFVGTAQIANMHQVAILSQYNVPQIGRF